MIRGLLAIAFGGALFSALCIRLSGAAHRGTWHVPGVAWTVDTDEDDAGEEHAGPASGREAVVTRTLPFADIQALTIQLPGTVICTQGPTPSLTVTGPAILADRVTLRGGTLRLDGAIHHATVHRALTVAITAPSLHRFDLQSAVNLDLRDVDADLLAVTMEGAGSIRAAGRARAAAITIEGAGVAELGPLALVDATIEIDGIGHVTAAPTGTVRVTLNGAGQVTLTSRPAHLQKTVSGIGNVSVPDAPPGTQL